MLRNASGMTLGRWASVVFDRLETWVHSLNCNRQSLSPRLGSGTCAGSLLGGREPGKAGNNATIQAPRSAQPHLFTWPVPTSEKRVPPTSIPAHAALSSERSECFPAAKSQFRIYFARPELTEANNNMCSFLESGLHFIVIWEQLQNCPKVPSFKISLTQAILALNLGGGGANSIFFSYIFKTFFL